MTPHTLHVTPGTPLTIGAQGMDAIVQNIRIIVLTTAYSVPLDRGFAHLGAFLDSPAPHETARLIAQFTSAIEKLEPRVRVTRISLEAAPNSPANAMQGRLFPHIFFELKEGVAL